MPTYVLTTPVPVGTPGQATWTDSTLIPSGSTLTVERNGGGGGIVTPVDTINFLGAGVLSVAVGATPTTVDVTIAGGGGGAATLQTAYLNGQTIDVQLGTGDLVFDSTTNDGTFKIGNGTNLTVTANTLGAWSQTSASVAVLASTGNASLRTIGVGTTVEFTAAGAASGVGRGTQITASSTGTLFKASNAINPAAPPAAAAATLDLWGTLAAQIEPTGTLNGATVLQYTAFSLAANAALPALGAGAAGRTILIANNTANPLTVTPPVGGAPRARTLSPGGGSVWVWVAGGVNDWICLGYA